MTLVVRGAAAVTGLAAAARAEVRRWTRACRCTRCARWSRCCARGRRAAAAAGVTARRCSPGSPACSASLGVYGVVSYVVEQRTPEIGLRMALGASSRDVVRLVVGEGIRPVVVGLACGVAGAWGLGRALESVLFGVSSSDPLSYVVALSLLLAAAARRHAGPGPACASHRPDHGAQPAAVKLPEASRSWVLGLRSWVGPVHRFGPASRFIAFLKSCGGRASTSMWCPSNGCGNASRHACSNGRSVGRALSCLGP